MYLFTSKPPANLAPPPPMPPICVRRQQEWEFVLRKHGVTQEAVEAYGLPFPAIVTFGAVPLAPRWRQQQEEAEQARRPLLALFCVCLLTAGLWVRPPCVACHAAQS